MAKISSGISLTVLGLFIAALGVVAPIGWDWWNKRSQIVIETRSNVSILSISQPLSNLEVLYNGRKVSELHKVVFEITNSGKIPITKEDVITPLTLRIDADEVLEATIQKRDPDNLSVSSMLSGHDVSLNFDLLNPSDAVEVGVLVGGKYSSFKPSARIKNISRIEIFDSSVEKKGWKTLGVGGYVSGFFGLLFLLMVFGFLQEIPKKRRAVYLLKRNEHRILSATSADDAGKILGLDFSYFAGANKIGALKTLASVSYPLDESSRESVKNALLVLTEKEHSFAGAAVCFCLAALAFWYVFSKFLG